MKSLTLFLLLLWLGLAPTTAAASEETLFVGGDTGVKVLFFEPKLAPDSPPLAILISGGNSTTFMARAQFWLGKELVDRGWAIAVPISPDGTGFGGGNARLLPELVGLLQARHTVSRQKPLLLGISSGGSSALEIALHYPDVFSGVVATPGRLLDEQQIAPLHGLPIYLRIGERDDFLWNRQLDAIRTTLQAAGGRVDAAIVPDARHIFQPDWDNLETWLSGIAPPAP